MEEGNVLTEVVKPMPESNHHFRESKQLYV